MQFRFDELRATQAAAVLLKLSGGRQNYTWLLKVLYLADRKSLEVVGIPIAGATFCNMRNGPLASDVYDCIKGVRDCKVWSTFIECAGQFDVALRGDPGDGELSDFDVETLTNLYQEHRGHDWRAMIRVVHGLSEWTSPGLSSEWLDPEKILRAVGIDEQTIRQIDEHNCHVEAVREL